MTCVSNRNELHISHAVEEGITTYRNSGEIYIRIFFNFLSFEICLHRHFETRVLNVVSGTDSALPVRLTYGSLFLFGIF